MSLHKLLLLFRKTVIYNTSAVDGTLRRVLNIDLTGFESYLSADHLATQTFINGVLDSKIQKTLRFKRGSG